MSAVINETFTDSNAAFIAGRRAAPNNAFMGKITKGGRMLREVLDKKGVRPADFAREMGVIPQNVSVWLIRGVAKGKLRQAAEALQCDQSELDPDYKPPRNRGLVIAHSHQLSTTGEKIKIPFMNVRASMGSGADVPDHLEVVKEISVDVQHLRRIASFSSPKKLTCITGIGDSMKGTYEDGDVLLIDEEVTEIRFDAIYALERGNELFVKRLQRLPDGGFLMISDNAQYRAIPVAANEMENFRVRGRVVLAWNARKL